MASMSNYLENKLADHVFRTASYTPPTTLYYALYTAAPSDSGGGTEVSGGAYARAAVTRGDAQFKGTHGSTSGASSGTGGVISNAGEVAFPTPSGANWGLITHWGVFDDPTAGNLLFHGVLGTSKTVNNGDAAPKFLADSFTMTWA